MPEIKWITAVYGIRLSKGGPPRESISVQRGALEALEHMRKDLAGTQDLVAVYLPKTGPNPFHSQDAPGRVIGVARLLDMPEGRGPEDYPCDNLAGERQWPIGWPVEWVKRPAEKDCPVFQEFIDNLVPPHDRRNYLAKFHLGPFPLEREMREALTREFQYLLDGD